MTATAQRRPALEQPVLPSPAAAQPPGPPSPAPAPERTGPVDPIRRQQARVLAATVLLMAFVLLGFAGYLFGLSRLSEQRAQNTMFKGFVHELSQAIAPVGPAEVGTPVALLNIPSIGLRHVVVVEGTDSRRLASGPGHRRDTPLPGQGGVSVIYGRRATFGAPFAAVPSLRRGALIQLTTGQGTATYRVQAFGTGARPAVDTAANRLVLTTADSTAMPSSTVSVSADLTSKVKPSPGGLPAIAASEHSLSGAPDSSVLPLMLWGQALVVVAIVATIAVRRWSRWGAYLCFAPVALAVLWNVYENAATFLPNVW